MFVIKVKALENSSDTHETAGIEAFVGVRDLHTLTGAGVNEIKGVGDGVDIDDDAYMAYVAA